MYKCNYHWYSYCYIWYVHGSTLSDPDNFKNKTADVILQELFGF